MNPLQFRFDPDRAPRILCFGAHCDDILIGCGGTLRALADRYPAAEFLWVVLTSTEERAQEEQNAAYALLPKTVTKQLIIKSWRDGFLPYQGSQLKEFFEEIKPTYSPDLIFTHYQADAHQDHRLICELTWNTYRHHPIFEYEIPKYDGDMGTPNIFFPLTESLISTKIKILLDCYQTQVKKTWFCEDIFLAISRLRGMECNAPERFAEAFYGRKIILG